ncbi:MAG: alpha-L-arabinofuranosidase C-terminal domain-containing protein [Bryobacterales bacterium]|nr:alpha-L-arabinofuranosidase C-terminal domain-containing protein [Bryobacterales bacterium]
MSHTPSHVPLSRRSMLFGSAAGLAVAALPARAQSADGRIDVLLGEPVGTIAPEIYGHFVEHLGAVVYDGIWVGENSRIPHVRGVRKALVDALKVTQPPVIRWPGGCFADQYDWRDGTGDPARRPVRTNFWVDSREWPKNANRRGPESYDPNTFGTVEFVRFCRAVGAEPYLAANLRSLPAQEFWRWVEYCNSPEDSSTLAKQRAADGERQPLNVRYWGVGNESWGCGGNFTPEDYASEFRRFTAWVPSYGVNLALIGSGPNDDNRGWTRRFFDKAGGPGIGKLWGWGAHHYSWNVSGGRTRDWMQGKGDAVAFETEQYYELLRAAEDTDTLITSQWGVMAEADPQHRVKLVVDEWGAWHRPGTEPFAEALLGQQNTMRDAVLAGLSFDIFHRHADKVAMANIAQLVNCLQSLFFAHEEKFATTPTYHVFALYAAHQGGQSLRTEVAAPSISYSRNQGQASLRRLSSSASLKGKALTITVNNLHMDQPSLAEIAVRGGNIRAVSATSLHAPAASAHNSFANPDSVKPQAAAVASSGNRITHSFPPASVTKFSVELA